MTPAPAGPGEDPGEDLGPGEDPIPPTIAWRDGRVTMIDQRRLPGELVMLEATTVEELCAAIRDLAIRGAPALGVAGAMGMALAAGAGLDLDVAAAAICATRPTAVNLAWGVDRARWAADPVAEARAVATEDVERNRRLGAHGAGLVPADGRVLTHCNAGALACAGYGTALGVIRAAHEQGRAPTVWVDETRPVLQGARLTAWELDRLGIPATLVADGMAAGLMAGGEVDCVVVGADRVAANGDVANKVGTYGLAVVAAYHGVPFYVAAPTSTVDLACPTGASIPIEQRPSEEVTMMAGHRIAPEGMAVDNRAFDVTPASLVTAIVTEEGVARPPYGESLAALCDGRFGRRAGGDESGVQTIHGLTDEDITTSVVGGPRASVGDDTDDAGADDAGPDDDAGQDDAATDDAGQDDAGATGTDDAGADDS